MSLSQRIIRSVSILLLLSIPALAQEPGTSHKFWTRGNVALIAADGAAKGADAYFTHRVISGETFHNRCYLDSQGVQQCPISWTKRGQEFNPLARPFVGSTAGQIGYFAGTFAADIGLAYLAHKTGHHKMEKAVLTVGIGVSAQGAAFSAHALYTF